MLPEKIVTSSNNNNNNSVRWIRNNIGHGGREGEEMQGKL